MFIGHFALALGAKKLAPRASLGVLFAATAFLDLLWPAFLLLGWELVVIKPPDRNPFTRLDFTSYPYSHSLLMAAIWSVLFAVAYRLTGALRRAAWVSGALVFSHWVLDWITHLPDLPLVPGGGTRVGLGLWKSVAATIGVELSMFVAGTAVYVYVTRPRNRRGEIALWTLVVFLLIAYAAAAVAPPPPGVKALAWSALSLFLLLPWAWWADRNRTPASMLTHPEPTAADV